MYKCALSTRTHTHVHISVITSSYDVMTYFSRGKKPVWAFRVDFQKLCIH